MAEDHAMTAHTTAKQDVLVTLERCARCGQPIESGTGRDHRTGGFGEVHARTCVGCSAAGFHPRVDPALLDYVRYAQRWSDGWWRTCALTRFDEVLAVLRLVGTRSSFDADAVADTVAPLLRDGAGVTIGRTPDRVLLRITDLTETDAALALRALAATSPDNLDASRVSDDSTEPPTSTVVSKWHVVRHLDIT